MSANVRSDGPQAATQLPDALGRFGAFGGRFVPETLMDALNQLAEAYAEAQADPAFQAQLDDYLTRLRRPALAALLRRAADRSWPAGPTIYLKREDLNHTGAHKINNAIGQALLAQRMGKTRVIAETGAGQHGVATATACALFGLECTVYMGEEDIRRQKLNVFNMKTLGAEVVPGHDRLADAPRRDQRGDARLDGLVERHALHHRQRRRPAPVPDDRPRLPGGHRPRDPRSSACEQLGRLPDVVVACVGGGINAAGHVLPVHRRRRASS